jgi:hypothetical protein
VDESFLFLLKDSKVHHVSSKWLTNRSGRVLPDLKNPTKLMALKMDERSSHKWPAKVLSSMASLHEKWLWLKNYLAFSYSETPSLLQEPMVYID